MSPWSEYRSVVLQYFVLCRPPPGCRLFSNFCFRTSAKCWRYFSEEQQSFVTPHYYWWQTENKYQFYLSNFILDQKSSFVCFFKPDVDQKWCLFKKKRKPDFNVGLLETAVWTQPQSSVKRLKFFVWCSEFLRDGGESDRIKQLVFKSCFWSEILVRPILNYVPDDHLYIGI